MHLFDYNVCSSQLVRECPSCFSTSSHLKLLKEVKSSVKYKRDGVFINKSLENCNSKCVSSSCSRIWCPLISLMHCRLSTEALFAADLAIVLTAYSGHTAKSVRLFTFVKSEWKFFTEFKIYYPEMPASVDYHTKQRLGWHGNVTQTLKCGGISWSRDGSVPYNLWTLKNKQTRQRNTDKYRSWVLQMQPNDHFWVSN